MNLKFWRKPKQPNKFGWVRDLPDRRDLKYTARPQIKAERSKAVDLTPLMPPIYNQGNLGSCTANAIGAALQYLHITQKIPTFDVPSRLSHTTWPAT